MVPGFATSSNISITIHRLQTTVGITNGQIGPKRRIRSFHDPFEEKRYAMDNEVFDSIDSNAQHDDALPSIPSGGQAACRAIRILQILQERTDASTYIPFDDIATELRVPTDERLPPIPTDRRALSTAVAALRAVGIDIVNVPRTGYAILEHHLADDEAAMLGKLVIHSCDINARQRGKLLAAIMGLSSPTARQEIEMGLLKHPAFGAQKAVSEYRVSHVGPRELIELSIAEKLPFSFELDEHAAHGGQALTRSYAPQALYPTVLTDRYGTTFVTGRIVDADDGEVRVRTLMISRLRNLTLRLRDGSLVLAALRDGSFDAQRDAGETPSGSQLA